MATKVLTLKLKSAGPRTGPFKIEDDLGNVISESTSRQELKSGISFFIDERAVLIIITSLGRVKLSKSYKLEKFNALEYANTKFTDDGKSCLYTHLRNPLIYNTFYGNIEPYIIEYPFTYQYSDQILQSVEEYTKVYKYVPSDILEDFSKYEVDDAWFNKAIVYNGQESSGLLNLVQKPQNNLQSYGLYPILNTDSKDIIYTKNDNFYQYNTFWALNKDKSVPLFIKDCESLSRDKQLNQDNMDYSNLTYKKNTIRAKELKIRHILDNRDDINLVSQFIVTPTQISYK